jgi:hypothetical protein
MSTHSGHRMGPEHTLHELHEVDITAPHGGVVESCLYHGRGQHHTETPRVDEHTEANNTPDCQPAV